MILFRKDREQQILDLFKKGDKCAMDKLYQEYAEDATERGDGIGIAAMLYEQMKRNYNIE